MDTALSKVTGGDYNTAVGQGAGLNIIGGTSTFLGHNANTEQIAGASNRTALGAGATTTVNKSVVLGNTLVEQVWMSSDKGADVYAQNIILLIQMEMLQKLVKKVILVPRELQVPRSSRPPR